MIRGYLLLLSFLLSFVWSLPLIKVNEQETFKPTTPIFCSKNLNCPEEWPCCSPYGECGSGPTCVGGCDPRYSYEDDSCIPLPVLMYPFNVVFHHDFVSNKFKFGSQNNARYPTENENVNQMTPNDNSLKNTPLEAAMHQKRFIHHSKFLITKSDRKAEEMLYNYNFVYSGNTNIDDDTGEILLTMPKHSTGSLIASTQEFLYGKATVSLKTARSQGVVTAIVLMSQVGDEIDFEFLGSQRFDAQTNWYYQTELDYTRMQKQPIYTDSYENYHTYGFDWNEERIIWLIDGRPVRTLFKRDTWDPVTHNYKYPQTPARLEIAIWPGGDADNHPGTIEWAGGPIDWENSPDILQYGQFYARVKEIHIEPKQNEHFNEIYKCITRKSYQRNFDITELLRTTCSYDHYVEPKFSERSLQWHCDYTPRVKSLRDSGSTTQSRRSRFFKKRYPSSLPLKKSQIQAFTNDSETGNSNKNITRLEAILYDRKRLLDFSKIGLVNDKNNSNDKLNFTKSQILQKILQKRDGTDITNSASQL
ncbi:similar to Saccharomyces cerevisiae YLR213C CRR1 Putative glycoside hydrolase of the spore wall envelope [Maudiozyma saulgeensis]|uniref:Similar to Saccharomyces cerevisiae YLR213C CRR1 Putative glycoside hydrolase of the spore wall envelope n=1 Tax=Maudiozyma saulgeensis TaxID=1789683 RepID=A0A1X7R325_9SACH|nr:similar to Saccharomyces cerevisiae YLR213C CRR1 Putative glycoside hydrolase of the spore wall envelope [Kazachstania saulgeensis]